MNIAYYREKLASYPGYGPRWRLRVQNMPDNQVFAIYMKFLETGKFDLPKKTKAETKNYIEEQLTIYDLLRDKNQLNNEV